METRAQKLETLLISNIEKFLTNQGQLVYGSFGFGKLEACPLNTIIVNSGANVAQGTTAILSEFSKFGLDFSFQELLSFMRGFDDDADFNEVLDDEFFYLGNKLREKYKPERG